MTDRYTPEDFQRAEMAFIEVINFHHNHQNMKLIDAGAVVVKHWLIIKNALTRCAAPVAEHVGDVDLYIKCPMCDYGTKTITGIDRCGEPYPVPAPCDNCQITGFVPYRAQLTEPNKYLQDALLAEGRTSNSLMNENAQLQHSLEKAKEFINNWYSPSDPEAQKKAREFVRDLNHNTEPAGWQLVPVEPTEKQLYAAYDSWKSKVKGYNDDDMINSYKAMLAAAPKANQDGAE